MSDEARPTIAASMRTETKTCRRLAPTMRSNASSFVRWPTMIENVFRIVNPPTNSAMNAKTSNAVLKMLNAELILLVCSLTTVWPVTTSTPGGSAAAIDRCTVALSAPGLATTSTASNWPGCPNSACAVGMSNAASVAPARLFAVPNLAMPVMVNVRVGPFNRIRTRSPTENPYFCAVPRSITTSCGVVGGRPCTRRRADMSWLGSNDSPSDGACPDETALPSWPMYCAKPVTVPSASPTPGTARTVDTIDCGTVLRVALPPLPNCATPRTWKSMFW